VELKKVLPQAEFATLPGLGHYPSEENTKDFLVVVDRFLERVEAAASGRK
jgi:pimeloyl-ACP methyl ester carboxylesterase